MVSHAFPDVGKIEYSCYSDAIQMCLLSNTRVQKKVRGSEGTSGKNDFLLRSDVESSRFKGFDTSITTGRWGR